MTDHCLWSKKLEECQKQTFSSLSWDWLQLQLLPLFWMYSIFFSFLCAHLLGKLMDNYKNNSVLSIVKIISWAGSDVEMSLVVFNFYPQQMQQVLEPPPPPVLLPGAVEANRRQHNILNFSIKILSFLILF